MGRRWPFGVQGQTLRVPRAAGERAACKLASLRAGLPGARWGGSSTQLSCVKAL